MDYTPNLELIKPAKAEQYNIEYHNKNSDIIDAAFKDEVDTRIAADTALQEQIDENRHEEKRIGTVPIEKGGTGETTAQAALNALHGGVQTESDIGADDEITFLRRTAADPETETPESVDLKDVRLDALAAKVYELIRRDSAVFTAEKNGLAPKTNFKSATNFLRADGEWGVPQLQEDVIEVKNSNSYSLNSNTIMHITAENAVTIILEDSTRLGLVVTILNTTSLEHTLSCKSVSSEQNVTIKANAYFKLLWNGSAWQAEAEPLTYQNNADVFPVKLGGTGADTVAGAKANLALDKVTNLAATDFFTAISNASKGISATIGGTTKSVSNIDVDKVDGYHVSTASGTSRNNSLNALVPVVAQYFTSTSGYIKYANGLNMYYGVTAKYTLLTNSPNSAKRTFDLLSLGAIPDTNSLFEVFVNDYGYDNGDYKWAVWSDLVGGGLSSWSRESNALTFGGTDISRHMYAAYWIPVRRYLYTEEWSGLSTRVLKVLAYKRMSGI